MKTMKIGVILLALLLAAMAMVPIVSAGDNPTKEELLKTISTNHFTPSKEFTDYINAPSITEKQKTDALKIASASLADSTPLSTSSTVATQKKFGDYVNSPHGSVNIDWAYPYSGDIYLSMIVGSPSSNEYGRAYAIVNADNGSILSEGFTDEHKYW